MAKSIPTTGFDERLRRYGLFSREVQAEILHIGKKETLHLSGRDRKQPSLEPRLLACKNLDDVKMVLGIPDSVFDRNPKIAERRTPRAFPPESLLPLATATFRKLKSEKNALARKKLSDDLNGKLGKHGVELSSLAYHYIFGNSRLVLKWKPLIEWKIKEWLVPLWVYKVVEIEPGGVLEFDSGTNILCADRLVIHDGARIRALGPLTIDVRKLERPT
jgi:hypothetical protein